MPCDSNEHGHAWPTSGRLAIERCEKYCAFCKGESAKKRWSFAWFLRRHVRDMHVDKGEYPDLVVVDGWDMKSEARIRTPHRPKKRVKRAEAEVKEEATFEASPPSRASQADWSELGPFEGRRNDSLPASFNSNSTEAGIESHFRSGFGGSISSGMIPGQKNTGTDSDDSIASNTLFRTDSAWEAFDIGNMIPFDNESQLTGLSSAQYTDHGTVRHDNAPAGVPIRGTFDQAVEPRDFTSGQRLYYMLQDVIEQAKASSMAPEEILFVLRQCSETLSAETVP